MEQRLKGKEVLIIDDNKDNLRLLDRLLSQKGYKVRTADGGNTGLEAVEQQLPDLILLDLQMPDIDGFEVCKRLKTDKRSSGVPILFLSAADNIKNITKGFELGGVDFIPKPFHNLEVLARVKTQLENQIKNAQLVQMAKQKSLRYLIAGMAHEINTPLGNAITAMSIANEEFKHMDLSKMLEHERNQLNKVMEAQRIVTNSLDLLKGIVQTMKELNIDESQDQVRKVQVLEMVKIVQSSIHEDAANAAAEIITQIPDELQLTVDYRIFLQILSACLQNAVDHAFPEDFTGNRQISIRAEKIDGFIEIAIGDNGVGIPESSMDEIFDPFFTTLRWKKKLGLGLYIVQNSMISMKGSIQCTSRPGEGTEILLRFPVE
jgi:two-component system sensor histidine kinase/response regulator